jgi:hypothetical protein
VKEPRFIVSSVTGVTINPASPQARGGRVRSFPTSFYVLDRGYCHRTVASFNAEVNRKGKQGFWTDDERRVAAHAKAAELNAWDAEEAAA